MSALRVRSGWTALAISVAAAAILTVTGTRLAASQETMLVSGEVEGAIPAGEPFDGFWSELPAVDLPLSAQQVTPPMGGRSATMRAASVHDGETLYVMVEWSDASPDRSVGRTEDFTDAVAVQFPAVAGSQVPAFCMGDPTATVNIWHWRAASQADLERDGPPRISDEYPNAVVDGYPFADEEVFAPGRASGNPLSQERTSAVDNLVSAAFGSLTADELSGVQGTGDWRDGRWRVVFSRPLQVGREGNIDLHRTSITDVAFAVWDGAAEERDGIKSVANFVSLRIAPAPPARPGAFPEWPMLVVLAGWLLLVALIAPDLPRARR